MSYCKHRAFHRCQEALEAFGRRSAGQVPARVPGVFGAALSGARMHRAGRAGPASEPRIPSQEPRAASDGGGPDVRLSRPG